MLVRSQIIFIPAFKKNTGIQITLASHIRTGHPIRVLQGRLSFGSQPLMKGDTTGHELSVVGDQPAFLSAIFPTPF